MSNINSLYQNGAGSLASFFAGEEHSANQERQALAMQFDRQKMEQTAQMHPLDMQQKEASLAQMHAQLPGIQGQSMSALAKGQVDHASMGMELAETLSKSANQLGKDGMDSLRREGEVLGQAAKVMAKVPPAMHKQVLQSFAQQYGTTNSPLLQAMLQAPDDELLPGITEVSKGLALTTAKYIQESALKKQENDSQENINKQNNAAKIEAARIAAEARANAEKLRSQARQENLPLETRLSALLAIPETERSPTDWDTIQSIQQFILKKRAAGANAVPSTVLEQQSPLDRAEEAGKVNRPAAAPKPQPTAGMGQDFKAIAIQAWGAHEPEKYEYGINPDTGRPARRPK